MDSRKKWLIVLALVWLLLFFFSTRLTLIATGYNLKKIKNDEFTTSSEIRFDINRFSSPEGLLQKVNFEGWAFNPANQPETGQHASLILKSVDFSYELEADRYRRPDVSRAFPEMNLTPDELGFIGSFSTIAIDTGFYEMFIKLDEADRDPVVISTNKYFQKIGNAFIETEKEAGQPLEELKDLVRSNQVNFNVEACKISEDRLTVKGWAYLTDQSATADTVQLQVTSGDGKVYYFETEKYDRPDVANHFEDENYLFSGFVLSLKPEKRLVLPVTISVIINETHIAEQQITCSE